MIDIKIADWGRTAIIPGFSLLHEEFAQAKLKITLDIYGSNKIKYVFHFDHLPMNGNIDTKYLIKGAKLYLSVECKGALFSTGDGEFRGTAVETPVIVSVRLTIRHGEEFKHVTSPCLLTQPDTKNSIQYYLVLGIADNILKVTKKAIIRATQIVDTPNYTVGTFLPLNIFANENDA
jgi:acetamidase/formamidase